MRRPFNRLGGVGGVTNHPKAAFIIDKFTLKCTHCNKIGDIKSRCFELIGYSKWWDHNRGQRKKDSKKALTLTIVEIKIEDNVAEKASALVATSYWGG